MCDASKATVGIALLFQRAWTLWDQSHTPLSSFLGTWLLKILLCIFKVVVVIDGHRWSKAVWLILRIFIFIFFFSPYSSEITIWSDQCERYITGNNATTGFCMCLRLYAINWTLTFMGLLKKTHPLRRYIHKRFFTQSIVHFRFLVLVRRDVTIEKKIDHVNTTTIKNVVFCEVMCSYVRTLRVIYY